MDFSIIVATDPNGGVGFKNTLPWRLPGDMKFFKETTTETRTDGEMNVVVMGRKTWESIPPKFRPLPNRLNVVLTRNAENMSQVEKAVLIAKSLDEALSPEFLKNGLASNSKIGKVFVIGGGSVYEQAVASPRCVRLYLTRVLKEFDCDTFFKFDQTTYAEVSTSSKKTDSKSGVEYEFVTFERKAANVETKIAEPSSKRAKVRAKEHEEYQYLKLIRNIIENGMVRKDRTGTGTKSIFGATMRFDLRNGVLPVLTTKRVFWRGVAEELFWFVAGCTDNRVLQSKRIHIWDGNGSKEFLEKRGLGHRREGDLGPVYGFQWRHFGAEYGTCDDDYTGKGVDQLAWIINEIKTNPTSRRLIMSAWNPSDLPAMALPPCHLMAQFYVDTTRKELSCQMYQRSADMGLGVPFNIASYSLLTHLIAHCCGLRAGEFVHVIGDAHVYLNHIDPLKEQLKRVPGEFPTLKIKTESRDIDQIKMEHVELVGYKPQKTIKMAMAV